MHGGVCLDPNWAVSRPKICSTDQKGRSVSAPGLTSEWSLRMGLRIQKLVMDLFFSATERANVLHLCLCCITLCITCKDPCATSFYHTADLLILLPLLLTMKSFSLILVTCT